jgi:hypothetical protein
MRASWSIPFLAYLYRGGSFDTLETLRLYLERLGHIVMSAEQGGSTQRDSCARCDVLTDIFFLMAMGGS